MRGSRKLLIAVLFMAVSYLVVCKILAVTGAPDGSAGIISAIGAVVLYVVGGNVAVHFAQKGKEGDPK